MTKETTTSADLRYLITIYRLSEGESPVSSTSIANGLGITRPSVSTMLNQLMKKDLIRKERYGKVHLTEKGAAIAEKLVDGICYLMERMPEMGIPFTE